MSAPATTDRRRALGARASILSRTRGPDDPASITARQELAEAQIEAAIQKVVADTPPLRPEQAERLAGLIHRGRRL